MHKPPAQTTPDFSDEIIYGASSEKDARLLLQWNCTQKPNQHQRFSCWNVWKNHKNKLPKQDSCSVTTPVHRQEVTFTLIIHFDRMNLFWTRYGALQTVVIKLVQMCLIHLHTDHGAHEEIHGFHYSKVWIYSPPRKSVRVAYFNTCHLGH